MLYFAYGSNLDRDDLARWCGERGLDDPGLIPVGPAFLPDRRLAFTHRSTTRGGGVLDVPPSVGSAVEGVLFRVAGEDALRTLDRKEGEGHAYRRLDAVALTDDGAEVRAFAYEVAPEHRQPFVEPPASYLDVVRRGYDAFDLDRAPFEAAALGHKHPGPVAALFVYGTLRAGEARHGALARRGAVLAGYARTRGTLLDLGPYPALVADPAGGEVVGELYATVDPGALLSDTDAVEGFRGFGVEGSFYRRAIVRVTRDDGRLALAWTYLFGGDPGGARAIPSGDWMRRQDVP